MSTQGAHYGCTNRSLPGCNAQGSIGAGTRVKMHCWIDDSWADGAYRSNRWFFVTTSSGIRNFVHSSRVSNQTSVPHCGSHRGIAASRWAAMQIGETRPSNIAEKANNPTMDRWSGWCYVLAWDSHALSHGARPLSGFGSAKSTFYAYQSRGKVSGNLNHSAISIGSIVFWTNGTYGHAAIYAGQGMVVSTQGNGSSLPPNARLPMSHFGTPAGWVSPGNI
ncbi:hypothetical protein [Rhabdothermincola salaria]|uniref:hypothetical protein n=1 Tax=Rhabdothermincola salaria TaxID=2903142 RepID=UPI001E50B5F0|nr:hypothetical protein [Rhabdothermincola salaria]MCD9625251.1 hypothetical protein [Rhabdothermincola salaria]